MTAEISKKEESARPSLVSETALNMLGNHWSLEWRFLLTKKNFWFTAITKL
jgi:hypothetical protein